MYKVAAALFFVIGLVQLFITYKSFKLIQKEGNQSTSPFIVYALWTSVMISIALITAGFMMLS